MVSAESMRNAIGFMNKFRARKYAILRRNYNFNLTRQQSNIYISSFSLSHNQFIPPVQVKNFQFRAGRTTPCLIRLNGLLLKIPDGKFFSASGKKIVAQHNFMRSSCLTSQFIDGEICCIA